MTKEIQDELIRLNVINFEQTEMCKIKDYTQCPIFNLRSDGCIGCKFRFATPKETLKTEK
jgi:hypothetical protein